MRAVIKSYSTSQEDVFAYELDVPHLFSFLLTLAIGPASSEGEDFFEVVVTSPASLQEYYANQTPTFLRHILLMADYNVPAAVAHVSKYIDSLEEDTWLELASQIGRMTRWEFEDYRPRA